ncbi:MAG: hypothetical protein ABR591_12865 [Candidatus Velthaea sp.]
MKRLVSLVAALVLLAGTGHAVSAQARGTLAPADQYFGRLKMSILGIRNSIKDLDLRADRQVAGDAEHVFDKLVLVEDALHEWQSRYPRDPWIPKYAYSLAMVYNKLAIDDARVHMNDTMDWLMAQYPASEFAQLPR